MATENIDDFDPEKIARFLARKGVSPQDFAEMAGVSHSTWWRTLNWARGVEGGHEPQRNTKRAFMAAYRALREGK